MKTTDMRVNLADLVRNVSNSMGLPAVPVSTEFLTRIMEDSYKIGYDQSKSDCDVLTGRRIKTLRLLKEFNDTIAKVVESLIDNKEHSSIVNSFKAFASENHWQIVQIEKELGLD